MTEAPKRARIALRLLWLGGLLSLILCGTGSRAWAGGFEVPGFGSKALALGGAFVGQADDWTASYWNPAGLARLEGKGWGFSLLPIYDRTSARSSIPNKDPGDLRLTAGDVFARVHPTEPLRFDKTATRELFLQPNGGGYFPWRDYRVGLAFYNPLGNFVRWGDLVKDPVTDAEILGHYFTSFFMAVLNASVARQFTPKLSLGVGLNLIYSQMKQEISKDYTSLARPELSSLNYHFESNNIQRGLGPEGMVGALYQLTPALSLGAIYRTGSNVRMKGHARAFHTFGTAESSDFKRKFLRPTTWGVGVAYRPIDRLSLTLDWQGTDWRPFRADIHYDDEGKALRDIRERLRWKLANRYRLGVEWAAGKNLWLRTGLALDQSGLPREAQGFTVIPNPTSWYFPLGFGYRRGEWSIEGSFAFLWGLERNGQPRGTIHQNDKIMSLSFSRAFGESTASSSP